jgi:ADP-ribosyl-[dinitrogen reductase] hydrolase
MSSNNTQIMEKLFNQNLINANKPQLLFNDPPALRHVPFSKVEGMLLGIAIGDSLGNGSESISPRQRKSKFGIIEDYIPNRYVQYQKKGLPTDDTQLSFDTLIVILKRGHLDLQELGDIFASHRIFGIGSTVKDFLRNYKDQKKPWYLSGTKSSGNGALMRIAPVLIPYLREQANMRELWSDVILDTMMTHNDALAIGSSLAFVDMLTNLLRLDSPPDASSVLHKFCSILSETVGERRYQSRRSFKSSINFKMKALLRGEPVFLLGDDDPSEFIRRTVAYALQNEVSVEEFGNQISSGAYLLETVPISLYILLKNLYNPQNAMIEAVNYTKDNDTIAAIVGAAIGALYGRTIFKDSWITQLSGRIREKDDGTIFRLIEETKYFLSLHD